jgi:hypothetical protein
MGDLAALIVNMVLGSVIAAAFLLVDRRRLDAHGRARMWNDATLALAIGSPALGLGIPPFISYAAHVWVTRSGRWYVRLGKALLAMVVCFVVQIAFIVAALEVLGLPLDP